MAGRLSFHVQSLDKQQIVHLIVAGGTLRRTFHRFSKRNSTVAMNF